MGTKIEQKMIIFAEGFIGFDFSKMVIFLFILKSIFKKNEIQNEIKMSQKWPKNS